MKFFNNKSSEKAYYFKNISSAEKHCLPRVENGLLIHKKNYLKLKGNNNSSQIDRHNNKNFAALIEDKLKNIS